MILSQSMVQGKATHAANPMPARRDSVAARDHATTCPAAGSPADGHPLAHDQLTHFVGFDWASDHHDVCVVDRAGKIVRSFRFDDTAEGWHSFRETLAPLGPLAVVVETRAGAVVERLLDAGLTVFAISPKAAQRYRERKAPAGTKNDQLDAWSSADALRSDGHAWRALVPDDAATQELRLLCRDEVHLIELRTSLVLQLRAALGEYFPAAIGLFDEWTVRAAWSFVVRFPTPAAALEAGRKAWRKFFIEHGLSRGELMTERLDILKHAHALAGSPAVTAAKSRLAVTLARQLLLLDEQLGEQRRAIEERFERHADRAIFESLPGAGAKLAPRLLAEFGSHRDRFDSVEAVQCHGGSAPVSFQSGQIKRVRFRRACNKFLRTALHLWANLSRAESAWAAAYYQQKKAEGQSHACALRCLAQRWLKILWRMWQTRTPYDESIHLANQRQHGSWVVPLLNAPTA